MPSIPALDTLIADFCNRRPLRAGSLIISLYGDAIAHRGGVVWLGSLINLLEPLGLNQRLIRTSIFRLTKEGWLSADQVGRRSYYSLTPSSQLRFDKAFKRVYAASYPQWSGHWVLVLMSQLSASQRKILRQELEWQGFGSLASTVMLHPQIDHSELQSVLQSQGVEDKVIVMNTVAEQGVTNQGVATLAMRQQTSACWNLDRLSESYQHFLDQFRPLWSAIKDMETLDPKQAFLARTLLIHEFRRILLRDPQLPEELLPGDWEGRAARQLCANLYKRLWKAAELHFDAMLETAEGPLPKPNASFYKRYGGLA